MLLNGMPRVDYQNASEFLNRAGIAHDPNLRSTIIMSEDSDSGTGTVSAEYHQDVNSMAKTFQTRDRALSVILEDKTNRESQGTDTFLSSANSFDHAPKILAGIISLSPAGENNAFAFKDN